tara:strand:+ start:760 stop:1185 length:426 start_codon:yes stop_codon:yes gene_type:complete
MKTLLTLFVLFFSFQINAENLFRHYPTGELKFGTYICNVSAYYSSYTNYGEQKFETEKINFKAEITIKNPEYPVIILDWIDYETGDKMNRLFFPLKLGRTIVGSTMETTNIIILSNEDDSFRKIWYIGEWEEVMRGECKKN